MRYSTTKLPSLIGHPGQTLESVGLVPSAVEVLFGYVGSFLSRVSDQREAHAPVFERRESTASRPVGWGRNALYVRADGVREYEQSYVLTVKSEQVFLASVLTFRRDLPIVGRSRARVVMEWFTHC